MEKLWLIAELMTCKEASTNAEEAPSGNPEAISGSKKHL